MVSVFCNVIRSVQGGACGLKLGGRGTVGIIANLGHFKNEICVLFLYMAIHFRFVRPAR